MMKIMVVVMGMEILYVRIVLVGELVEVVGDQELRMVKEVVIETGMLVEVVGRVETVVVRVEVEMVLEVSRLCRPLAGGAGSEQLVVLLNNDLPVQDLPSLAQHMEEQLREHCRRTTHRQDHARSQRNHRQ